MDLGLSVVHDIGKDTFIYHATEKIIIDRDTCSWILDMDLGLSVA